MKISVCMGTFNGSKYITTQLSSILTQLGYQDEIVIVDDASEDNTKQLIEQFGDSRIKLFANTINQGVVLTFEKALKLAEGDIIFLSDQDDVWSLNKIKITRELLTTYDMVISDCTIINDKGDQVDFSFFRSRNSGSGIIKNIYKNTYLGCCIAFRRSLLEYALPFPSKIPMHDMWLGLIAEVFGKTFFCTEKLVSYRRHSENSTQTGSKSSYTLMKKMGFRFSLIMSLVERIFQRQRNFRIKIRHFK